MFVRISRVKRHGKVYEYAQLVESYRKKGRPAHRVIASLKDWHPRAIQNLKLALAAARHDQAVAVVPANSGADAGAPHAVVKSLRFLPCAVYAALWDRWQLAQTLDQLLPSAAIVDHSALIEVLTIHRAVAPGSKLSACSWYPKTALPELLGIRQRHCNNSRLHRALDALAAAELPLQEAIAARVARDKEGVRVTYLDLTDTWFVGRGPPMARKGKTKEGLYKEKIGIALMCDQRGFPLRWKTVQGCRDEASVFNELLGEAVDAGIIDGCPVVMDRAMGRGLHLEQLTDHGVHFVTALVRHQFATYVDAGPWERFGDLDVAGSPRTRKRDIERLGQLAREAGMQPLPDGRFVLDRGVAACPRGDGRLAPDMVHGYTAELIREVDRMQHALATGAARTRIELAEWYGVTPVAIRRYLQLADLSPEVRRRVFEGDAEPLYIEELRDIATMLPADQARRFDELLAHATTLDRHAAKPPKILDLLRGHLLLRRVIWFSPELLLQRRATAREQSEELDALVTRLNQEQRERSRPRPATTLLADVRTYLKKHHLLELFHVTTRGRRMHGRDHQEVVVERDDSVWARRRRLDGFQVAVAHPMVHRSAADLVHLYFSKDLIEKDFRVVKSEIELRPVRHRTDPKVRAHVSLCMLALLLQRLVEQRLAASGTPMTASPAMEILTDCRLNALQPEAADTYYTVTQPNPDQRAILDALDLAHLVDDLHLNSRIRRR